MSTQFSLCACGCGSKTTISARTEKHRGILKGEPTKYLKGHHLRKSLAPECGYVVDSRTGCWNWSLYRDSKGYGYTQKMGRKRPAHVWVWEEKNGVVPKGLEIDHLCRNPSCVNPDHLEAVTSTENKRRSRSTKLNAQKVLMIRESNASFTELARQFSVTWACIYAIKSGRTWIDVVPA